MGPENINDYTLYLGDAPIGRGQIQIAEITVPEEVRNPKNGFPCEYMECKLYFKIPKHWRCRGRKRFVKLMMSEGISRNYAEWLAGFARTLMPYGEAWRAYILYKYWKRCAYDNRID